MFTSRSPLTSKVYGNNPNLMGSYKLKEGTTDMWRYQYDKEFDLAMLQANDGSGLWYFTDMDGTHIMSRITALWPHTSLIFGKLLSLGESEIMLVNAVKEGI